MATATDQLPTFARNLRKVLHILTAEDSSTAENPPAEPGHN
jgi:hypothetical protein